MTGVSEMGDTNHQVNELPILTAGLGMPGGQSIQASNAPLANLWLSSLRALDVGSGDVANFGNSTGTIGGLWT